MLVGSGQLVEVVWFGRWENGTETRSVFTYANVSDITLSLGSGILLSHQTDGMEYLGGIQSTRHEYYQIQATNVDSYDQVTVAISPVLEGFETTDPLPQQVAALVTGYTGAKRSIPKKYIPALCEDQLVMGVWGSTVIAALNQFAGWWVQQQPADVAGGFTSVARAKNTIAGYAAIQTAVARSVPATQRRRKLGVGI